MACAYAICIVTVPDETAAEKVTSRLIDSKLAACVTRLDGATSVYRWEGKIERAKESVLLIKTRSALKEDVMLAVRETHPYSVPEIIFADISDGNPQYLDWIGANTLFTSKISDDKDRKELTDL